MQILLSDLILQHLEPNAEIPRNRQLYNIVRASILDGRLPGGTRLPASRDLARELAISRNTVLYAYEQLRAEGYVRSRTGDGTFVTDAIPEESMATRPGRTPDAPPDAEVNLSQRGRGLILNARASRRQAGAFMPGVPDLDAFPLKQWTRLVERHWRRRTPENLTYGYGGGHPALKKALAQHLRSARSVACEPEQIIITEGIHQAIHLCVQMLTDVRHRAWVEDPGYWGIHKVLQAYGVETISIPVDAEGLSPSPADWRKPPRLIFVTPSHQYPLGHVMSLARRRQLLQYARKHDAWIVEDDYDSEFRYAGRPIASLQGLEPGARVLYAGTFSKTLFPGLRIGYLVVPKAMVGPLQLGIAELYREGRWMDQAVLADFIGEGYYSAHIRRMRLIYGRRRALLQDAIRRHMGDARLISADSNAGLHLTVRLAPEVDDVSLSARAQELGLIALPLSRYYLEQPPLRGLVLGYGCVPDDDIEPSLARLASLLA